MSTLDTRNVSSVELFLTNFNHTWIGDLIVTLQHVGVAGPVTVLNRVGASPNIAGCSGMLGCGANLVTGGTYTFATGGAAFSSVASISDKRHEHPYTTYASANSLAPLTWRLTISDNAAQDITNTTWTWGVNLTVPDAAVPEPSTLSMVGLALSGMVLGFRRRRP